MEPSQDDELTATGPIDSDEEKDLVMAALVRSRPAPLVHNYRVPLKQRYQMVRMKEMLGSALGGRGGGGLFRTSVAPPKDDGALGAGLNGFGMNGSGEGGGGDNGRRMSGLQMHGRMPSSGNLQPPSRKQSMAA